MKRKAVFAGSFDPFTLAHFDLVRRSVSLFDELVVLVGVNRQKRSLLTVERRKRQIEEAIAEFPNVSVDAFDGLTVDYLKRVGAKFLVRGVRSPSEFDSERNLAWNNLRLYPEAETVFLPVAPEYSSISSSAVREILSFGGDVSGMLPQNIYNDLCHGDLPDVRTEAL